MIILTTDNYPGKNIVEVKGLVKGSTVKCKNVGRDIGSAFKNLVGGEMVAYKEMLDESREVATARMVEEAESLGANAIVSFRMMSSAVAQGAAEMVTYGTAVVVE
ncbi:MAG: heavy metal-binding domain-containing protein [Clostridium sp.]|uniref:heavy metal-binding domain-containing protein n=1 Tax=Clostridium sp. TaxID=1506 RepID=UPI003F319CD3